jgi:hypothetical protein
VKFVYYRSLASCFDLSIEKLDDEALNELRNKAELFFKSNEALKCDNQSLSMTDVFAIIDSLKSASTIVFHDWIKSDKAISIFLRANEKELDFQETVSNQKYVGHALEKQFYSFLTPYLRPIIEKEITELIGREDFEKLRFYLQFSIFIEESKKIEAQQAVDRHLRSTFSRILSRFNESNEELNSEEMKLLTSLELVDLLNILDKQFYALRVKYVDTVKRLLVHPDIEPAAYKGLSRAVNSVELNNSHKPQVESFLQQGKSKVYKTQKTSYFNKGLLRNPLTYLGFVVIIILVVLIFPFDFKQKEKPSNQKISGIDSLSQEELKTTDSLLGFKNDSALFQTNDMIVPEALPDYILSDNSGDIQNKTIVGLYESMLKDYEIQQNNYAGNCDPLQGEKLEAFNYDEVGNIQKQNLNHKVFNESNQDCYMMIFENKPGGSALGVFLAAGDSVKIKAVKNWRVIFYTGKDFTKFNPLKTSNNGYGNLEDAKKIDKTFTAHFCKMNYSNFRVLSKIYNISSVGNTTRLINNSSGALEVQSERIIEKK